MWTCSTHEAIATAAGVIQCSQMLGVAASSFIIGEYLKDADNNAKIDEHNKWLHVLLFSATCLGASIVSCVCLVSSKVLVLKQKTNTDVLQLSIRQQPELDSLLPASVNGGSRFVVPF